MNRTVCTVSLSTTKKMMHPDDLMESVEPTRKVVDEHFLPPSWKPQQDYLLPPPLEPPVWRQGIVRPATHVPQEYYQQQQQTPPPSNGIDRRNTTQRRRRRPPHSYASMIAQAILTSEGQKLTLRDIYEWVQTRYPHMYEANEPGWQVI